MNFWEFDISSKFSVFPKQNTQFKYNQAFDNFLGFGFGTTIYKKTFMPYSWVVTRPRRERARV